MDTLPGLGCHADRHRIEVGLFRRLTVGAGVKPAAVVKIQMFADRFSPPFENGLTAVQSVQDVRYHPSGLTERPPPRFSAR